MLMIDPRSAHLVSKLVYNALKLVWLKPKYLKEVKSRKKVATRNQ